MAIAHSKVAVPEELIMTVAFFALQILKNVQFLCTLALVRVLLSDFITTDCNPGFFLLSSDIVSKKIGQW